MQSTPAAAPAEKDVALSVFDAGLGVWLVASSFLWPHTTASLLNQVAVGVACAAIAVASLRFATARWLYVPLSAWLFASAYVLPLRDPFSAANLVAMAVALVIPPLAAPYLVGVGTGTSRPGSSADGMSGLRPGPGG